MPVNSDDVVGFGRCSILTEHGEILKRGEKPVVARLLTSTLQRATYELHFAIKDLMLPLRGVSPLSNFINDLQDMAHDHIISVPRRKDCFD